MPKTAPLPIRRRWLAAAGALLVLAPPALGLPGPFAVELESDLVYGTGQVDGGTAEAPLRLDLYSPVGLEEPTVGVLLIHGGGYTTGDKTNRIWKEIGYEYASQGLVAASINYRLRDDAPPAPPDFEPFDDGKDAYRHAAAVDARAAVRWMRAHADELGVDPHWIFLLGASAGGATAVLAGTAPPGTFDSDLPGGSVHPDNHPGVPVDVAGIVNLWGKSLPTYLDPQDPPILSLHGSEDTLVDFFYSLRLTLLGWRAGADLALVPLLGYDHAAFDAEVTGRTVPELAVEFMDERVLEVPEPAAPLGLAAGAGLLAVLARRRGASAAGAPARSRRAHPQTRASTSSAKASRPRSMPSRSKAGGPITQRETP